MTNTFTTIDGYIDALPEVSQPIATALRQTIKTAAPAAVEAIKYNMPAFQTGGIVIIYFAVWKKHISLYPIYRGTAEFEAKVAPYRSKKDTVQFPLDRPLPYELIAMITKSQIEKQQQAATGKSC